MEALDDPHDLRKSKKAPMAFLVLILPLLLVSSLHAEELVVGEGEHKGPLISQGKEVLKIGPVKPGQNIQVVCLPQWSLEKEGKVTWSLEDANGTKLRVASHTNPETDSISLEWTSNSGPKPEFYVIQIQASGGSFSGQALGEYTLFILLRDQNDGGLATDAPETYQKALLLPMEPGNYLFGECFLSGTADLYDIYKIQLKPKHSLSFKALPLQWKGTSKGKVTWEFLDKSYKPLKRGQISPRQSNPLGLKLFHPKVRSEAKSAVYYFLVKIEGDASLFYSLHLEIKEGP
jgi:hypothetical protein